MELEEEDEAKTGCCFVPALSALFTRIGELVRKRGVKQRRRNYRVAKIQEEERVASESPDKGLNATVEQDRNLQRQVRPPKAMKRRKGNSSTFSSCYTVGEPLGQGGFGSVFAGTRKADGAQVAIKVVPKGLAGDYITVPGSGVPVPREVALMMMASEPSGSTNICRLLEWFDGKDIIMLILERPQSSIDVGNFCLRGRMSEREAAGIMRQVVLAAKHCHDRGVLHRDIKPENLLINTKDMTVKLIDFGCGDLLKDGPYDAYAGTLLYSPPEWNRNHTYEGRQATVWSLGVLLYYIVKGVLPFKTQDDIISKRLRFRRKNLSSGAVLLFALHPPQHPSVGSSPTSRGVCLSLSPDVTVCLPVPSMVSSLDFLSLPSLLAGSADFSCIELDRGRWTRQREPTETTHLISHNT
ncbi:hypothetical protein ACEWY4_017976 [Coilia grayii]|uniref:non-specific serine/threonine protein kinase n=1 Tax=Coilia grayii TaxID=363190 RepID=A0ABD1JIB2_9TELE